MFQVYVLVNEQGKNYIGLSDDVARRLIQQNEGLSKWTRGKEPWSIIWTSEPMFLSDARKLENKLKRQGRGSGFYTMTGLPRPSGSKSGSCRIVGSNPPPATTFIF